MVRQVSRCRVFPPANKTPSHLFTYRFVQSLIAVVYNILKKGERMWEKKCSCLVFVSISTFDASVTNISLSSSVPPISPSLCLPAPLEVCISESQCTLNSYVLVSYGYSLHWRAGVPFPFSALRAPYQRSHNVQCVHKTCTQSSADIVQTSALTHALHSVLCIIIVI